MKVSIVAQVDWMNSHALHLAQLVKRLPEHGIETVVRPIKQFPSADPEVLRRVQTGLNDCEVEIIIGQPRIAPTPGKKTIYLAAWESTILRPGAVEILNACALVIAPSNFCAQTFSSCGVTAPIHVVPLGFSEAFECQSWPERGDTAFFCAGNLANGPSRKGIQRIIDHFIKAFPNGEKVVLNVKLHPGQAIDTRGDNRIYVDAKFWPEDRWVRHMATCHCLIHYGVGAFELPVLEAMAIGRPVIAPQWGGHADYFNGDVGIAVHHDLVHASDSWKGLGHWAEVEESAAISAMRWVVESIEQARELGFNAHHAVQSKTWANHALQIATAIKSLHNKAKASVVFPVCQNDIALAIRHAQWLKKLARKTERGRWGYGAIIAHDGLPSARDIESLSSLLSEVFENVSLFRYPPPPVRTWPSAPNWVFQHVARYMALNQSGAWLWFEPDCVALSPRWADCLFETYKTSGKRFMGPIVRGMGHMNGCGIYPSNTPTAIPSAMSCVDSPFDFVMKPEMIHDCHDASHLIQHIWTVRGEHYSENSNGDAPANISAGAAKRWLKPSAVMVHRIKDQSLTDMLISGSYRHH